MVSRLKELTQSIAENDIMQRLVYSLSKVLWISFVTHSLVVSFFGMAPCPTLVIRGSQQSPDLASLGLRCKRGIIKLHRKVGLAALRAALVISPLTCQDYK